MCDAVRGVSLFSPNYPSGFKRRDETALGRRLEIEITISSFKKEHIYWCMCSWKINRNKYQDRK